MGCGCRVVHFSDVERSRVEESGSKGTWVRWLISWEHGAPNFAMRMFEVEPGGNTPLHSHGWEHEIFILEGEAKIICGDEEHEAREGYAILIPPNVKHSIVNTGDRMLRLLCLIPRSR